MKNVGRRGYAGWGTTLLIALMALCATPFTGVAHAQKYTYQMVGTGTPPDFVGEVLLNFPGGYKDPGEVCWSKVLNRHNTPDVVRDCAYQGTPPRGGKPEAYVYILESATAIPKTVGGVSYLKVEYTAYNPEGRRLNIPLRTVVWVTADDRRVVFSLSRNWGSGTLKAHVTHIGEVPFALPTELAPGSQAIASR